jgi:adenylate cyclase
MPIPGKASEGWGIYASGQFSSEPGSEQSDPTDLRDDLKFAELTASFFGSLREQRRLERERASLSPFFSPVVLETLGTADPDVVLQPREAEVTVLFCDLRGFSRASEKAANDLLALLGRVSSALGIATRQIVEQSGVLGDFHGDAVMGFWGWPLAQADAAARAARAALAIRAEFQAASQTEDSLSQFRVGIGIGTGRAVAGKIGTINQVKVTAFGPVVNLASRLENITKTLQAPILLDERTAQLVREQLPANVARLRRVARIKPFGLEVPLEVTELLPPENEFSQLTCAQIGKYEQALDDFCAGHWQAAFEHLHQVPADDRVKDFLTMFIVQHGRTAPEGWNGVISLPSK